ALRARRLALEQTTRALEPAVGDGVLAAERPAVPGQPHRHARRRGPLAALLIELVRALPRLEHHVGIVQPPGGGAEAFERFGGFLFVERSLKGLARFDPRAAFERRGAGVSLNESHRRRATFGESRPPAGIPSWRSRRTRLPRRAA